MKKNYTRSTTMSHRTPVGEFNEEIVIHLPDPTLLRIIARSVLLAAAILSFPWLRVVLLQSTAAASACAAAAAESKWVDDPFSLPMLVADLRRQGFLACGATALFLGDARSRSAFLKKKRIDPVAEHAKPAVEDRSVDFILAADGLAESDPSSFGFVDRVVKVGGVVVAPLGSEEDEAGRFFRLPPNYRLAYIRRYGATFVGIKKMFHANAGESEDGGTTMLRWLLSVAGSKSEAPEGLEGVLSELPELEEVQSNEPKYLPGLMGDNLLVACQKRVFVGVKKMFYANAGESEDDGTTKRRLLSVAGSKSEAPEGLEDDALSELVWEEVQSNKPKYLPGLMGDNLLVACQKRVIVGVKKMFHAIAGGSKIFHANAGGSEDNGTTNRRLLLVAGSKSEAMEGLERALSERPEREGVLLNKPNYLLGPVGDNLLVACQKRVFVGVKKMFHANAGESEEGTTKRRLLSVTRSKSESMEGLEDTLMDPPEREEVQLNKSKCLPGPVGDNLLAACQKRLFMGANAGESEDGTTRRQLLSVARSKSEAMEGLEDAFLEPPEWEEIRAYKPKYLPDLMGDNSLVAYPKRVFVDVGEKDRAGDSEWFGREYPKKGSKFEIVKVDLVEAERRGGIAEWLRKNVREEEFVVMKAEAEVVEEMVREKMISLVDELLLECNYQKRAYWECLSIYGRVRAEGIAVHQWWE